jgi:uncharacterized protein YndB with AHSA1/START domain
MTAAELVTEGERPAVRLERHLPDPPGVVWCAITEREQLRSWFPCDVLVQGGSWTVGAAITFVFPPQVIDMTLSGKVLEVEEPHKLSYTWGDEVLRFELTPDGEGTRLVLTDELAPDIAARNAAGWDDCLDRLLGLTPADGAWKSHFDSYAARFEPVVGPQVGPPAGYKGDL